MDSPDASVIPIRQTAAQRRALPDFRGIADAVADDEHVCRRPVPMRTEDPATFDVNYIGAPCKATVESVCPACAKQARFLRITQCHEGWHMDTEPVTEAREPTEEQKGLVLARSDLFAQYQHARESDDTTMMDGIRDVVGSLDTELRELGFRGRLPGLDAGPTTRRKRSTRRRQDAPDLPRKKVAKTTIGREFAGKYRPSTFVTLTLPSYGPVHSNGATDSHGRTCGDGSPRDPESYDYAQSARDIVHFSALFDRWIQNLRRAVGWDVQYFATVEPQNAVPHTYTSLSGDRSRTRSSVP